MIISDGESLFNENFIARGMLTIQDITNENGLLLSWQEAKHKFSLNNSQILHWMGIIKCIPKLWRTKLYHTPDDIRLVNQLRQDMLNVTSKSTYTKLIKSITGQPTSQKSLRLFKFGIAESPLCFQCMQEKEPIIHLFVTCRVTDNLWEQLCAWLSEGCSNESKGCSNKLSVSV